MDSLVSIKLKEVFGIWSLGGFLRVDLWSWMKTLVNWSWTGHETLRITSDQSHETGSAASHARHMNRLSCIKSTSFLCPELHWGSRPRRFSLDKFQDWGRHRDVQVETSRPDSSSTCSKDEASQRFVGNLRVAWFNVQNVTECEWCRQTGQKLDKTAKEKVSLPFIESCLQKLLEKSVCVKDVCKFH